MAYPTGSGSEILRRGIISPQSNSATAFRFDGTSPTVGTASYTVPALHIITMLSIILCEKSNATRTFTLYAHDGTTQANIIEAQSVAPYQTFVFSDRIVIAGADELTIRLSGSGNVDVWVSYIEQRWV